MLSPDGWDGAVGRRLSGVERCSGGKKSTPADGWTERQPEGTKGWEMFLFPDVDPEIFWPNLCFLIGRD